VALVRSKLERGVAEGSLRLLDDRELTATAYYLVGARHFLEDMIAAGHRDDDLVEVFITLVRNGLGRGPASSVRREAVELR
jgi:hypothetical protein